MSEKQNKEIVREFAERFKNQADHGVVDELFTPDFKHHFLDERLAPGREGLKQLGAMVVQAFPDVRAQIEDLVAEGDKVVERTSALATHTGAFAGIPPTGKQVRWDEIHVYRLQGGKIAELWPQLDMLGLVGQLTAGG